MTETSLRRPSRRSHPNLHHLSLAPLSSIPLDASAPPSPDEQSAHTPTSYIAARSPPATPGILSLSQSRSTSRSRRRPKTPTTAYAHDGYFIPSDTPERITGEIPKAKSTSILISGSGTAAPISGTGKKLHHIRKRSAGPFISSRNGFHTPQRPSLSRHHTSDEAADEWLHRAGLAIAGETRESKGQSWLVRRASSTSLVRVSDGWDEHPHHGQDQEGEAMGMRLISGEHWESESGTGGGGTGWASPRALSRLGSHAGSRIHSARGSRRGSRVLGKLEVMTRAGMPEGLEEEGYFGGEGVEADFVGEDEESVGDEEEVARLARERGFGLGGWMDRLIGWTLFSVEEDGESSSDDDEDGEESMTREELQLKKEVEARRKKMEREAIVAASAANSNEQEDEASKDAIPQPVPAEGEGGWQDAAWLLSVASKVLL